MAASLFARWQAEDSKTGDDDEDAPRVVSRTEDAWTERASRSPAARSASSPRRSQQPPAPPSPARSAAWVGHAAQTTEKVSSILAFLDEAERTDDFGGGADEWGAPAAPSPGARSTVSHRSRMSSAVPMSVGSPLSRGGGGGGSVRSGLANEVFDGVRSKLLDLRVEVEEKGRMVQALKAKLVETKKKAKSTAAQLTEEKEAVQADAEQAINRQLAFIDRLLGDKKALGEKNASLVAEQKAAAKKFDDASETLARRHAVEMRKAKEKWSAAERAKREKWAKEKMKSIKDSTIQGLAPEIQRLISTHQAELRRLRATHSKEMLAVQDAADARVSEMSRRQHAELQKQLTKASDDTIATIETRVSRHEAQHANEIESLRARHAEEKISIEQRARSERDDLEESHRRAMERVRRDEEGAKSKLRDRIDAIQVRRRPRPPRRLPPPAPAPSPPTLQRGCIVRLFTPLTPVSRTAPPTAAHPASPPQEEGKRHVEVHTTRTKEATQREQVSFLCTVTFHANLAHSLTRSPEHISAGRVGRGAAAQDDVGDGAAGVRDSGANAGAAGRRTQNGHREDGKRRTPGAGGGEAPIERARAAAGGRARNGALPGRAQAGAARAALRGARRSHRRAKRGSRSRAARARGGAGSQRRAREASGQGAQRESGFSFGRLVFFHCVPALCHARPARLLTAPLTTPPPHTLRCRTRRRATLRLRRSCARSTTKRWRSSTRATRTCIGRRRRCASTSTRITRLTRRQCA
jgi:hypothetical protein